MGRIAATMFEMNPAKGGYNADGVGVITAGKMTQVCVPLFIRRYG